jgi:hypothetical protein
MLVCKKIEVKAAVSRVFSFVNYINDMNGPFVCPTMFTNYKNPTFNTKSVIFYLMTSLKNYEHGRSKQKQRTIAP